MSYKPPASVAEAAKRGLELRSEQEGDKAGLTPQEASEEGIGSGVQRAVNLKNRDNISLETIKAMSGFFARFKKQIAKARKLTSKKEQLASNMYVSDLLWGGKPGEDWVNKILKSEKVAALYLKQTMTDKEMVDIRSRTASSDLYTEPAVYNLYPYLDSPSLTKVAEAVISGCKETPVGYTPDEGFKILYAYTDVQRRDQELEVLIHYEDLGGPPNEFACKAVLKSFGSLKGIKLVLSQAPSEADFLQIYSFLGHEMAHALDPYLSEPPKVSDLVGYVNHPAELRAFLAQILLERDFLKCAYDETPSFLDIDPYLKAPSRKALKTFL